MPFGKLRGKLSHNSWVPAKTKKDKQQDKRITRLTRRVMGAEVKTVANIFYDMQSNVSVVSTVAVPATPSDGVIIPLVANLTQGNGSTQRIGTTINVTGICIKIFCYDPVTTGQSTIGDFCRFMLVYDKRFGGTYLNKQQLLETSSTTNGRFDDILSDYDIDHVDTPQEPKGKNVKILWDRTVAFGRNGYTEGAFLSTDHSTKMLVYNKRYKTPKIVNWVGGTQGPQTLYMVVCPGPSTDNTDNPQYNISSCVYFTDT